VKKRSAAATRSRQTELARSNAKYRKQLAPLVKRIKKDAAKSGKASPKARRR
jgi:hypothetical protein